MPEGGKPSLSQRRTGATTALMSEPASADLAVATILRGNVEQGFDLYERCLRDAEFSNPPAGLHIGLLEQAGRAAEAQRLTALALRYGADLAPRAGSFLGAEPRVAAQEYEALFALGLINARMIYRYLLALARLDRWREHAEILAPGRLFKSVALDPALAEAVDALLLDLEQRAQAQESAQSVRNMRMTTSLGSMDHPAARALVQAISAHAADYLAQWRASDHPLARFAPERLELLAWGLISRGEGYNVPHIHGEGWATGVFYPRSIEGDGGELVVGRPEGAPGSDADWGGRTVKPEAGTLLLFPSFYTHWTVPLNRPGLRTSVAFDVVAGTSLQPSATAPRRT